MLIPHYSTPKLLILQKLLLLFFLAIVTSSSAFGKIKIESPAPDSIQQGVLAIHGWSSSQDELTVSVDSNFISKVKVDTLRTDVNENRPSGFSLVVNYGLWPDGDHILRVVNPVSLEFSQVRFKTVRLAPKFLSSKDISPVSPMVLSAGVAGSMLDMDMQWDTSTQSFRVVGSRISNSPMTLFQRQSLIALNAARNTGIYCAGNWFESVPGLKWSRAAAEVARSRAEYLYAHGLHPAASKNKPEVFNQLKAKGLTPKSWAENSIKLRGSGHDVLTAYTLAHAGKPHEYCTNIMSKTATHFGTAMAAAYSVQEFYS